MKSVSQGGVVGTNSPAPGSPSGGAASSTATQDTRPEGAQRLCEREQYVIRHRFPFGAQAGQECQCGEITYQPITLFAARYDARRQDRINERCDAAEHDPGTPEAWAQGCECERQDGRDGWDVAHGCPMHDPRGE